MNERGLQWIDKEDWVYETCFTLAADMMRKENMELVFEGLDTYADVYLNDECILKADNMFRRWSIPVRQYIREENNILKVYFHSPVKIDVPKWDALPYQYPASNDQSENGGLFNKKISILPVRQVIIMAGTGGRVWLPPASGVRCISWLGAI